MIDYSILEILGSISGRAGGWHGGRMDRQFGLWAVLLSVFSRRMQALAEGCGFFVPKWVRLTYGVGEVSNP